MGNLKAFLDQPLNLAKVIVQCAAQAVAGVSLVRATYNLEGDNPLVFTAHYVFQKLESDMNAMGAHHVGVVTGCRQATAVLTNYITSLDDDIASAISDGDLPLAQQLQTTKQAITTLDRHRLKAMAREVWQPGFDYYNNMFIDEPEKQREGGIRFTRGELNHLRQAFKGASVFDPDMLQSVDVTKPIHVRNVR